MPNMFEDFVEATSDHIFEIDKLVNALLDKKQEGLETMLISDLQELVLEISS